MRIQHPSLQAMDGIAHGFFTRRGGTSKETYHSLNCGYGSGDERAQVQQNRTLVAQSLGVESDKLVTAYQVHSPTAMIVNEPFAEGGVPKLDALVTNKPGLAVAILTADCGPLLFADPNAGLWSLLPMPAGAVAFEGVIADTVAKMEELGSKACLHYGDPRPHDFKE